MRLLTKQLTYLLAVSLFSISSSNPTGAQSGGHFTLAEYENTARRFTIPTGSSLSGVSQDSSSDFILLYMVFGFIVVDIGHVLTTSKSEADAIVNSGGKIARKGYVAKTKLPGTVPLYRLKGRDGRELYTIKDDKKNVLIDRYDFQYLGILAYVYPEPNKKPGMELFGSGQGAADPNLDRSFRFYGWKTSEGSRAAVSTSPIPPRREAGATAAGRPAADVRRDGPASALKRIGLGVEWRTDSGISGLLVTSVVEGSAAEAAELRVEDIIKKVNGQPVSGIADFTRHLNQPAGTTLRLEVWRDEELEIFLRLP